MFRFYAKYIRHSHPNVAGDVASLVAGKKHNRRCHIAGGTLRPSGIRVFNSSFNFFSKHVRHGRFDESGRDSVHGDIPAKRSRWRSLSSGQSVRPLRPRNSPAHSLSAHDGSDINDAPARAVSFVCNACWMHRCAPVKFVRITAVQSSCFMRIARPSRVIAALFNQNIQPSKLLDTCLIPPLPAPRRPHPSSTPALCHRRRNILHKRREFFLHSAPRRQPLRPAFRHRHCRVASNPLRRSCQPARCCLSN